MLTHYKALIAALLSCYFTTAIGASDLPLSWLSLGPNGTPIARTITTKTQCPTLLIDGQSRPMQVRSTQDAAHFPVTVCEAQIPTQTRHASIDGQKLALPKRELNRIVVIGDTGCIIKPGVTPQACNNPARWPFHQIARSAAEWQPDLVIHLGDYFYREVPCPKNNPACAGSPSGDNFVTWDTDFFTPAQPLLTSAPWVFVRGNHEDCGRGGEGWFRFLDPAPYTNQCQAETPSYFVPIGKVTLFVLDSAYTSDFIAPLHQVKKISAQLDKANQINAAELWLVTHKPFWFIDQRTTVVQKIRQYFLNTLQIAGKDHLSPQIKLLLAGHIHRFETLNFASEKPPQMIVGNSGAKLDKPFVSTSLKGSMTARETVESGLGLTRFGFATLEKTDNGWRVQAHNLHGRVIARCTLKNKKLICKG